LQQPQLVGGDAHAREVAEAGVDAIDDVAVREGRLDRGAAGFDAPARRRCQRTGLASSRYAAQLLESERAAVDLHHVAANVQRPGPRRGRTAANPWRPSPP